MVKNESICDFCSSTPVVFNYPCKDFIVYITMDHKDGSAPVTLPWSSEGHWAACEFCASLIEAEEWDKLAMHSANTSPLLRHLSRQLVEGEVVKAIKEMHKEFRALKGERVPVKNPQRAGA